MDNDELFQCFPVESQPSCVTKAQSSTETYLNTIFDSLDRLQSSDPMQLANLFSKERQTASDLATKQNDYTTNLETSCRRLLAFLVMFCLETLYRYQEATTPNDSHWQTMFTKMNKLIEQAERRFGERLSRQFIQLLSDEYILQYMRNTKTEHLLEKYHQLTSKWHRHFS